MQHLNLQWGEARGRASFIVIIGLESPPVLIGMDIMRPLRVNIDATRGTATPAQPDPQTIHLNAAQTPFPPASRALLLQASDIPAEAARLVRCHNPWPHEDVYFCPEKAYQRLSQEYPPLPVDLRFGSPFTITDPNSSAYIQDKPWAPWRSSPSLTRHHRPPPPSDPARHLSPSICRQANSSS